MSGNKHNQKVTLETLLHLKKNERPKAEFWDSFERDFDRRRLHALVERPSWKDLLVSPAFRVFALGMPAMALVVMALIWSPVQRNSQAPLVVNDAKNTFDKPVLKENPIAQVTKPEPMNFELDTSQASNQFVVDAFEDRSGSSMRFRKVLYSPALRLSVPSGSFYVRDNLSSSNYKVTTADVKLGRNF